MTKTGAVLLLFCCSFFYFYFLPHFSSKWSGRMRYIICQNGCIDDCFFSNWSEVQISTKNPKDEKNWNSSFFLLTIFPLSFLFLFFFFPFFFSLPELTVLLQNFFSLLLLLFSSLLALLCYLGWFILFSSLVGAIPIFFFVFCWPMRDCEWMMEWSMMNVEVSTVFL